MNPLLARITIDPSICHGKPCVRGLRYPVEMLLELLSSRMAMDEILADYEDLEREAGKPKIVRCGFVLKVFSKCARHQ
jgi:uncharacterized protein (DUF433 family)